MSSHLGLTYKLIVRDEDGRRRVGPPQCFEDTAHALAGYFMEGFGVGDVELVVGLTARRYATAQEQAAIVELAAKIIAGE